MRLEKMSIVCDDIDVGDLLFRRRIVRGTWLSDNYPGRCGTGASSSYGVLVSQKARRNLTGVSVPRSNIET